ncbi:MAG TPA: RagB/SusD family nutrient uptake outer membrane protein [Kofleriaceae bacterium]
MIFTRLPGHALAAVLGAAWLSACSLDVPDLNNPGIDTLQVHPDAVSIGAACTGLLIGNRSQIANEFGYVDELGIVGRESYNFDAADPRFVNELLAGPLSQASPLGGNFWQVPYANIRLANVILDALDKVPAGDLDDSGKAGVRGFVHTMIALELLQVIVTRDTIGAVIDTDRDLSQPLGQIVSKDMVYARIASLLDSALPDLDAAGKAFPFLLSSGYAGFDTPAAFRKFNRALRARAAAYTKDYAAVNDALSLSFLDDSAKADFTVGVYYTYSTKTGDTTNGLINPNIYVHPSVQADAQKKADGKTLDDRYTNKVTTTDNPGSVTGTPLASSLVFTPLYGSPSARVGLIRNEELILLKAEQLFFTGDTAKAIDELNIVRTRSGGLEPLSPTTDPTTFTSELLYERRYSLLFEWGHRWIDVRRFDRATDLPLDDPTYVRNMRFPIPLQECNARPNEPACKLGSL